MGLFHWFMDRSLLCMRVFFAPLFILRSGFYHSSSNILISDPAACIESERQSRTSYLEHNLKDSGVFVSLRCSLPLNNSAPWATFIARYLLYCSASLLSFLDFSRRPYRLLFRFFSDSLMLTLCAEGRRKIYVFHIQDLNYYLIAGFCRNRLPCEVLVSLSPTPIGNWTSRYFDIDCTILLTLFA